jgi:PAS domain S-box-containing protein
MDKQEQRSKKQFLNELATLRRQLGDLEEQVTKFDLGGDTTSDLNSGELDSGSITPELQDVLEVISEAALVVDGQGRIIMVNDKAQSLFGYDQGELLEESVEQLIPARFRDRHIKHRHNFSAEPWFRLMKERQELVGRRKDGREIPLRIGLSFTKKDNAHLAIDMMR